jgi:hypothetical protein
MNSAGQLTGRLTERGARVDGPYRALSRPLPGPAREFASLEVKRRRLGFPKMNLTLDRALATFGAVIIPKAADITERRANVRLMTQSGRSLLREILNGP